MTFSDIKIAAPSTPSDISYDTVQDIRSPSPYNRKIDSSGGLILEFEGNLPPSSSRPQIFGHMHSPQIAPGNNIASILVDHDNVFEGQSPAPFTAPPSPAPSQRHQVHGISSETSQHLLLGGNAVSSKNDIQGPFSSGAEALAEPSPVKTPQKKRYMEKEELELTQRLNDLQSKYGVDHLATVDTARRLARIFQTQGRYRSSERLCRQSAESLQKSSGENDPKTLSAFSQLSDVLISQSRFSEAKTLLQVVSSRASRVFHATHPTILEIKFHLATMSTSVGNYVEAERILREIMVLGRETLPPDHDTMIHAMTMLADVLVDQLDYLAAEEILLVLYETALIKGNLDHCLRTRSRLGRVWMLNGNTQKSLEVPTSTSADWTFIRIHP